MALALDELNAITLDRWEKESTDIFFLDNVLLWKLLGNGNLENELVQASETVDGGMMIRVPLEYAEANSGTYGNTTKIGQGKVDIYNAARFRWAGYYASNTIDLNDKIKNAGDAAMINLANGKIRNIQKTIRKKMGTDIYAKVEAGDLSVTDAMRQSNDLTAEMTMGIAINAAGKRTEELLLDKDATAAEAQWHKDYPDYDEVVQSGALQEIISKSPMLIDETVAYFIYKGDQKFEEGQTKAEELAKNAAIADSVEKGPGAQMRTPVRQSGSKMSDIELVNSQMKTLQDFRAGKA